MRKSSSVFLINAKNKSLRTHSMIQRYIFRTFLFYGFRRGSESKIAGVYVTLAPWAKCAGACEKVTA